VDNFTHRDCITICSYQEDQPLLYHAEKSQEPQVSEVTPERFLTSDSSSIHRPLFS
jgi:hypothetical protein